MTLFGRIDEAIGHGSGLLSQTIGYVIVGIGQGVVFALLVPALDRLLSEDGQGATGWIIAIAVTAVFTGVLLWVLTERGYHLSVERLHDGVQRALGGAVEWAEVGSPDFDSVAPEGAGAVAAATVPVRLMFTVLGDPSG